MYVLGRLDYFIDCFLDENLSYVGFRSRVTLPAVSDFARRRER